MGNKIFVAYSREDRKGINQLPRTLGVEHTFRNSDEVYRLFSSNGNISDQMKKVIEKNAKWSDLVVVLIGKNTAEIKWIDWCIEKASMLGKKVIFIYLDEAGSLPDSSKNFGYAAVGMDKAGEAINGSTPIWETSTGEPFPKYNIDRSSC
ncbi:TIR domain-containing protein [Enterococcus sp. NPDC086594]|jgi:MTH538 TIR-like domain (DUF1863).|uniref:TIR domain-containing protein n=1 Tax=Enterococcus sp. NPDC086594 TaxID=3363992 RepID=UPI0037FD51CE